MADGDRRRHAPRRQHEHACRPPRPVVVNAAATFDLNNLHVTIGSLSGTGSVKLGSGALSVVVADSVNTDFGGVISGTGSLYKERRGHANAVRCQHL